MNAYKTIVARIRGAEQELQEMGEESDDLVKSTSKMRDLIKGITGVDIMKDENTYRDIYEIIRDIAKVYPTLSDIDAAGLTEALAGKNQANVLESVLQNFDTLERAYNEAMNAAGSAEAEQAKYEESIQYSIDRTKASLEELANTALNADFLKGFIDGVNKLIESLNELVKTFGLLPGIGAIGGTILGVGFDTDYISLIKDFASNIGIAFKSLETGIPEFYLTNFEKLFGLVENAKKNEVPITIEKLAENFKNLDTSHLTELQDILNKGVITKDKTEGLNNLSKYFADVSNNASAGAKSVSKFGKVLNVLAAHPLLTNLGIVALSVAVSVLAKKIGEAYYEATHQTELAKEKLDESNEALEETTSKLESANSELKTTKERIAELEGKDKLSLIENEELDKLKKTNEELERTIKLLEAQKTAQQAQSTSDAIRVFRGTKQKDTVFSGAGVDYSYYTDNNGVRKQSDSGVAYSNYDTIEGTILQRAEQYIATYKKVVAEKKELDEEFASYQVDHPNATVENDPYLKSLQDQISQYETGIQEIEDKLNNDLILTIQEARDSLGEGQTGLKTEADDIIDSWTTALNDNYLTSADKFDSIWNDESFANTKDQLLDLAESGKLSAGKLVKLGKSNEDVKKLMDETGASTADLVDQIYLLAEAADSGASANEDFAQSGVSKSDMISNINGLSEGFEELDKIMESMTDEDPFDFALLDDSKFKENFSGFEDDYAELIDVITNSPKDITSAQDAFDNLVTSYVWGSDVLKGVTDDNANLATQYLNLMGIENSAQVVESALARTHAETALESVDLTNVTYEEIQALANESEATDQANYAFQLYVAQKLAAQAALDVSGDISALSAIVDSLGIATNAWVNYYKARQQLAQMDANKITTAGGSVFYQVKENGKTKFITEAGYKKIQQEVDAGIEEVQKELAEKSKAAAKVSYGGGSKTAKTAASGGGSGSGSGSKSKSSDEENTKDPTTFDWMERKLNVLNNQIEKVENNIDNLLGYKSKNSATNAAIDLLTNKMTLLKTMQDTYQKEADDLLATSEYAKKLTDAQKELFTSEYINKIKNGDLSVEEIAGDDEDFAKLISAYIELYDKAVDCENEIDDVTDSIKELNLSKLDNIINQFEQLIDIQSQVIDTEESLLDLRDKLGEEIDVSDYVSLAEKQLAITKKNIDAYNTLKEEMDKQNLEEGSDEWKEYNDQLQEYKDAMIDAADAVEDYKDSMTDLVYKELDDFSEELDSINGSIETMNELIGDSGLVDEDGLLTDRGIAQVALYAQQLVNAKQEAEEYSEAIDSLDEALSTGLITQEEYNEMLYDYRSSQESAVQATKEAKDAIIDLVKEGIQAEIDAKKKLVDETKDALEAEQDLHDYQESIIEKQENISKLERQIAVLSSSTDRADIAQRLELQEELAEAKEDLYDTQYDHEIEQREQALDDEYEAFEEEKEKEMDELDTDLDKQEVAIQEYLTEVKNNYSTVYEVLTEYGNEYNLEATESLTSPWESSTSAANLCSTAIGDVTANIQYAIDSIDFSSLYELVDLLEEINEYGYSDSDADSGDSFEDVTDQGSWHKSSVSGRWWYGNSDDDYVSDGIYTINGKQYGFNEKGQMVTGWRNDIDDAGWRYFEPENGQLVKSSWRQSANGDWYYLDKNGVMASSMAIKAQDGSGYYAVDENGKWDGKTLTKEEVNDLGLKVGYRYGTLNASKGWHLTDEEGNGSEVIVTKDGILRQFSGGETVFSKDAVKKLYDFANDPSNYISGLTSKSGKVSDTTNDNREQNISIEMNVGGVLDEATLRIMEQEFPNLIKSNINTISDGVAKRVKWQTLGK